ncbi:MAG: hypothetical protein ACP59X_12115 [Solidesulfovibrio sp. DCME]|uniref:hypothetical protein n=1 Tax=Solidesulfovibrio sp. DCME TaxID=3447380 RepID=UPI003D0E445A
MTFTPLEAAAVAGFLSLLVALVTHALTKRNYVSHDTCEERRANVCATLKAVQDGHVELRQDIKDRTQTLFRMMRALVVHDRDMPPEVKANILNETPRGE